jgi:hypothetical protein
MKASIRTLRSFAVTAAVAILVGSIPAARAQKSIFEVVPTPNGHKSDIAQNALYASSASSPNDIWAVGNTTIHFDGKTWTAFPAPGADGENASFYLRGVLAISPTLAWAGGGGDEQGQIIDKWNGEKWERAQGLPFPPAWEPQVLTLTGTGEDDIWASGEVQIKGNLGYFVEHWDGKLWTVNSSFGGGVAWFYGSSQDAKNDAWVVGYQWSENSRIPLAIGYDGSQWIIADLPFPHGAISAELLGVLALAPDNVWAAGWQNSGTDGDYTNQTLIYHFDGNSWEIVPSPNSSEHEGNTLAGLVANSPRDIYAFGYSTDGDGFGYTLVEHWDGTEWKIVPSPNPEHDQQFIENQLFTGVAPSAGNVWIFGTQYFAPHCRCIATLALHTTAGE